MVNQAIARSSSCGTTEALVEFPRAWATGPTTRIDYVLGLVRIPSICSGAVLLQYTVEIWAGDDQAGLEWLERHQDNLRADSYSAVADWIRDGDGDSANNGQRIILPATYIGGARFISKRYHDLIATCCTLVTFLS